MKIKERKEIEYEEAPSGYVKMYQYKEPFMPFSEGYGYRGALMFDGETDKIQCHLCGEWFDYLSNHLHREHSVRAKDYKEMVGLRQTSALLNEKQRARLIANGKERFRNLRPGKTPSKKTREKIRQTLKKNALESKNEKGTCPLQLIDRLKKKAQELGRTPTVDEVSFISPLIFTYGTYTEACKIAGLEVRVPGKTITKKESKITRELLVRAIEEYYIETKKIPDVRWLASKLNSSKSNVSRIIKKYNKRELVTEVLKGSQCYHNLPIRVIYSKEELLDLIKEFKKVNGRMPSTSDCKRGLLPHASRFLYHFKSWKNIAKLV